jgi:hypothetical protein
VAFTGLVSLFLFIEIVLSFFAQPVGAGCMVDPNEGYSRWHWVSLVILDITQGLFMMLLAMGMWFV